MVWLNLAGHCSGSHSRSIHRSSPTFHLVKDVIGFKYSCSSAAQTAEGLNPRGSSVTFLLGHAGCRRLFNDHLYIIKTQKRSGAGVKQASRWIKAEPHLLCLSSFINSRKLNTYWPKLLPLSPSHVTQNVSPDINIDFGVAMDSTQWISLDVFSTNWMCLFLRGILRDNLL